MFLPYERGGIVGDSGNATDIIHEVSSDALSFLSFFQGKPVNQVAPAPSVSVGITGQSGLLIVLAVVVVGAVWIATRK
jgi:hypothetical protein